MNEYSCRKKDNQREFSREGSGSKNLVKFLMKIVLLHTSRLPYYIFCICMLTYQKYKSVELGDQLASHCHSIHLPCPGL